jgi:hypothetical protein
MSAIKEFYHNDIMNGLLSIKRINNPYSILTFLDGYINNPQRLDETFNTHQEAINKCKELKLTKYIIENITHYD